MGKNSHYDEEDNSLIDISVMLGDAFRGLKKMWFLFPILAAFIGLILCYKTVSSYVPYYTAQATFTITVQSSDTTSSGESDSYSYYYNTSTASQMAATFPYIIDSDVFMDVLKEDLNVSYINGTITAAAVTDSNMFTLSVTSTNPEDAYNILISVIDNYPSVAQYVIGDSQMNVQIPPHVPTEPTNSISYKTELELAIIISLIITVALIFLYAFTRNTVRTKKDIKHKLNQKQLGSVGKVKFKKHSNSFDDSITVLNSKVPEVFKESMRIIRIRTLKEIENIGNTIMVTSTLPNEGKSTISLNIAIEIAKQNKSVVLVDGDLRNPTIRKMLGIKGENGNLTDILKDRKDNYILEKDKKTSLYILGCDDSMDNPTMRVTSKQFAYVIDCLKKEMDYVIIDTPPCGTIADASIIAKHADGIVYVIKQDYVNVGQIINAISGLSYSKTKILGCVLNVAETGISGYGYGAYGYSYNYGYGYDDYGKYGKYGYRYGRYGVSSSTVNKKRKTDSAALSKSGKLSEDK